MKKALSIVLAVCILAGLCVGLSLTSSADVTLPAQGTAANLATWDAKEIYNNRDNTSPIVDDAEKTVKLTNPSNNWGAAARVEYDLTGLTATDDYVIGFTVTPLNNWTDEKAALKVHMISNNGANSGKTQKFVLGAKAANSVFYGDDAAVSTPITHTYENNQRTVYIYAQYDAASQTRTYHLFLQTKDQAAPVLANTYTGLAAGDPQLMFEGCVSGSNVVYTLSNIIAYKVGGAAGEATTTTTTTTTAGAGETTTTAGETTTTTTGTTTTAKPQAGIVNGVDTSKKGTGKDIEILAPGDTTGKNLADVKKATKSKGAKVDGNKITLGSGESISFDMSGVKATDDFIVKFKYASPIWWPGLNEGLYITFGKDGETVQTLQLAGNRAKDSVKADGTTFISSSGVGKNILNPVASYPDVVEYCIYVTTSPETGLRRVFFFANNKLFKTAEGKVANIENESCLTPCLTFVGNAHTTHPDNPRFNVITDVEAYVAAAPKFKEEIKDKAYTTAPVPNKDAKNYADLSKAKVYGGGKVDTAKGVINTGKGNEDGMVSIPLKGLKKTDSYVVSFMTTLCEEPWQRLKVTVAEDGDKSILFLTGALKDGNNSYHCYKVDANRLAPTAKAGDMTKIDILVETSVETGKRRVVIFQDGKVLNDRASKLPWETKTEEALTPVLKFATNGWFDAEVTNIKVVKLSDTKGYKGPAGTGNASNAVAALAVTAAVALPVIFVAKKKRKEEE